MTPEPPDGSVTAQADAGETVSTDHSADGASPDTPVETTLTTPNPGTVKIENRATQTSEPAGWVLMGTEVTIEAPGATAADPLVMQFALDGSLLPGDVTDVGVLRNGVPLPACVESSSADPDPCFTDRSFDGDDLIITVLTTSASVWSFGVADACPPKDVPDAGFSDVSAENVHRTSIDCAVWWSIAQGTAQGAYTPTGTVTRGQMASFVASLLRSAGLDLPVTRDHFADDDNTTHEAAINALAEAGVVRGTSPGAFKPHVAVTRAQMATFLVDAHELASSRTGGEAADAFPDDDDTVHEANINLAAALGFADGHTDGTYRPQAPVRRDQMASFVGRTATQLVADGIASLPEP